VGQESAKAGSSRFFHCATTGSNDLQSPGTRGGAKLAAKSSSLIIEPNRPILADIEEPDFMPESIKPINVEALKALVRTVPDFPKPGILFYDITTLLKDKTGFAKMIDAMAAHYLAEKIDLVLGIEARGFIFGPALAYRLNAGFVPVRKPRKLPAPVARVTYDLEYGSDTLEIHLDAIQPGQRVVLVDDLLATGGTMEATVKLVKELGGNIAGLAFAVELDFLKGRNRFPDYDVFSLLHYDE